MDAVANLEPSKNGSKVLTGSIEQKFVFRNVMSDQLAGWLEHSCFRDPVFHDGPVSSIYFDTLDMALLDEKLNGDFQKIKIRLRWYVDLETCSPEHQVPCFVEAKSKIGILRAKDRGEIVLAAKTLKENPFSDERILTAPFEARNWTQRRLPHLFPMMVISYRRRRFVDQRSGSRISLDTDIICRKSNPQFFASSVPFQLAAGVLEIKGEHEAWISSLDPVAHLLKKAAFSKYSQCCEYLLAI